MYHDGIVKEYIKPLSNIINTNNNISSVLIDVTSCGVKEGDSTVIANENTTIIQNLLNDSDDIVLYFPSGVYRLNKLNFGGFLQ